MKADQSVTTAVGPHNFPLEGGPCVRCGASASGALLDYRGIRTADGKTYARYPQCRRRRWWHRLARSSRRGLRSGPSGGKMEPTETGQHRANGLPPAHKEM